MLPKYLQGYGVRCTASAKLCVRTTYNKLQTCGWSKADETTGVDVIGHGPLGHSIIWDDSLRITKENSDQSLRFGIYINNKNVAELEVVLSKLLDMNDGSTKETQHWLPKTSQQFFNTSSHSSSTVGANAQARLIVAARVGTSTPFRIPSLKPALTVLTCPTNKLVRPSTSYYYIMVREMVITGLMTRHTYTPAPTIATTSVSITT